MVCHRIDRKVAAREVFFESARELHAVRPPVIRVRAVDAVRCDLKRQAIHQDGECAVLKARLDDALSGEHRLHLLRQRIRRQVPVLRGRLLLVLLTRSLLFSICRRISLLRLHACARHLRCHRITHGAAYDPGFKPGGFQKADRFCDRLWEFNMNIYIIIFIIHFIVRRIAGFLRFLLYSLSYAYRGSLSSTT